VWVNPALKVLAPRPNLAAIREFSCLMVERWNLVYEMTCRDVLDRYAGQALGAAWVIAAPLLQMCVYVFAFSVLFSSRLSTDGSKAEYVSFILSAMAPWIAITEVLGRAPTVVTANTGLVKQVVFPSEVLPLKVTLGALPTLGIGLAVVLITAVIGGAAHPLGWLLLPVPILCLVLMSAGFCYFLAALGVFLKDTKDIVGVLLSIGFFLHPIIYSPGVAPRGLRMLFYFSPISYVLWGFRDALFYGGIVEPWIWSAMILLSCTIFLLGYRTFRMLRPVFGNAL
jgi:lipopolysaccharide transport system permease protein